MEEITTNWEFQDRFINYCEENGISIWFLFSSNDHWVSGKTRSHLSDYYKDKVKQERLKIDVTDKIPHSFVVKHAEYAINAFFSVMASLNAMASMRVIVFLYQLSILGDCSTIDSLRDLMISQIVLAYNCISVHVNMYISTNGSEASIASRMSTLESCLF